MGEHSREGLQVNYRVYKLNRAGAIVSGEWIEALDEQDARRKAHSLCDRGVPSVELWQGARKVGVFPCSEDAV